MFYNLHMSNGCYYSWHGVLAWKYGLANSSHNNILIKYGPAAARIHNFVFGRRRRIVARVHYAPLLSHDPLPLPPPLMTCCLPFSRDSYWHSQRIIENLCREVSWSSIQQTPCTLNRPSTNGNFRTKCSCQCVRWTASNGIYNATSPIILARSRQNQWSVIIILDWHCIRRNSACAATIYSRTANIVEKIQFCPFRA